MDKPSELKPCPFCGSVAMTEPHPGVCEYVECQACNAYGPAADPDGLEWNRRAPDRAALVEVARTEKALAKWRDECARWRDKYDADVARMHSDIETLEHNARVGGEREEELERERDEARAALALVEEEKEKAVADEREACALVAQNGRFLSNESMEYKWGMACAAAIRARAGRNDG